MNFILDAQQARVVANQVGGWEMLFDQDRSSRSATDGLEPQGPGPGEQIDGDGVANARSQQVEDGLAHAHPSWAACLHDWAATISFPASFRQ